MSTYGFSKYHSAAIEGLNCMDDQAFQHHNIVNEGLIHVDDPVIEWLRLHFVVDEEEVGGGG